MKKYKNVKEDASLYATRYLFFQPVKIGALKKKNEKNLKKCQKNLKMSKRTHRCTPRGTCSRHSYLDVVAACPKDIQRNARSVDSCKVAFCLDSPMIILDGV